MAKIDSIVDTVTELNNEYYSNILPEIFNQTENRVWIQIIELFNEVFISPLWRNKIFLFLHEKN